MNREALLGRYRSHEAIRSGGAIGGLNEGPVITLHGVQTRLIAWPGNGFQTESVHLLALRSGEASAEYGYAGSEEAMLCVAGTGEVRLRDRWVAMAAGDIAYFPEGVRHALRHSGAVASDFVLVTQITPPAFELYAAAGFYHTGLGTMNFEACFRAGLNAKTGSLKAPLAFANRETEAAVRSWNLTPIKVRQHGALFNVFRGAAFDELGIPARLVVWPGAGTRSAGFNFAYSPDPEPDFIHTHPVSDECLFLWAGKGKGYLGGADWIEMKPLECLLAPCGVFHGHWGLGGPSFWGGFASPPQVDLLVKTPYYAGGAILPGEVTALEYTELPEPDRLFL